MRWDTEYFITFVLWLRVIIYRVQTRGRVEVETVPDDLNNNWRGKFTKRHRDHRWFATKKRVFLVCRSSQSLSADEEENTWRLFSLSDLGIRSPPLLFPLDNIPPNPTRPIKERLMFFYQQTPRRLSISINERPFLDFRWSDLRANRKPSTVAPEHLVSNFPAWQIDPVTKRRYLLSRCSKR